MAQSMMALLMSGALGALGAAATLHAQDRQPLRRLVEPAFVDTTCAPCEDFYQFATRGWTARRSAADGDERASPVHAVQTRTLQQLQRLLDSLEARRATLTEPTARKVALFYASCKHAGRLGRQERQQLDWLAGGTVALDSLLPRALQCVKLTDHGLTWSVGRLYTQRYFSPRSRARAAAIAANVKAVFRERLSQSPWLDDSSRAVALAKLDTLPVKVGYPDAWSDERELAITSDTAYGANVLAASAFQDRLRLSLAGYTENPRRWRLTASPIDGMNYADPTTADHNEVVLPAGFLQAPIFDPLADEAVNYGVLGGLIAHELAHGFIGDGLFTYTRQGVARLRMWVTDSVWGQYFHRAQAVARQFDGHLGNGLRVVEESVADFLAAEVAYAAFERSLAGKPRPRPTDGFTPQQRFFLAWAQAFREDTAGARLAPQGRRAPGHWRTNGPFANLPAFAAAWGCQPGTPMVVPESTRARIW